VGLSRLKLLITWFASDPQNWLAMAGICTVCVLRMNVVPA